MDVAFREKVDGFWGEAEERREELLFAAIWSDFASWRFLDYALRINRPDVPEKRGDETIETILLVP